MAWLGLGAACFANLNALGTLSEAQGQMHTLLCSI